MKPISVFYQGDGVAELSHAEFQSDATFADVKAQLAAKHGLGAEALLFIEDEDSPVDNAVKLKERVTAKGVKVHLHRCNKVDVAVTFNNETVERHFAPSATVSRVKRWAAEKKFGMSEDEAGEHVLQLTGTHERPAPGTHIGALTDGRVCRVAFDLVADERVNGASEFAA